MHLAFSDTAYCRLGYRILGYFFSGQDDAAVALVRDRYEQLEALLQEIQAAESSGEALWRKWGGGWGG